MYEFLEKLSKEIKRDAIIRSLMNPKRLGILLYFLEKFKSENRTDFRIKEIKQFLKLSSAYISYTLDIFVSCGFINKDRDKITLVLENGVPVIIKSIEEFKEIISERMKDLGYEFKVD